LEPLSEPDTVRVAQGASGDLALPDELGSLIYRKAEGNPFFIEEVTKSLVESGSLVRRNGEYVLGRPFDEIQVPDTVNDVIMARLDRLDEEPRLALQTASVIGREFTPRLLDRTAGLPTTDDALRRLKSVQLIFERSLYPEIVFMFKHALTHEVAYSSLLRERRRALHGAVGDAIRELYVDRPAEVVEMLAHHYERAERWDDAVGYLVGSAEKAMNGFASDEALAYAGRALEALEHAGGAPPPELVAHLQQIRGQCHEVRNEWPEAIASYRGMVAAAEASGDRAALGWALANLGLAQVFAHELAEGARTASRAAAIADETGDRDLATLGGLGFLWGRVMAGVLDDAYPGIPAFEVSVRQTDDPYTRMFGLDGMGELAHFQGDESRAIAVLEEALSLAEESRFAQPLQAIYFDLALVRLALGRYDEAFSAARAGIELAERVGDKGFWWCRDKNTLGRIYIELCDDQRGELHNQEAVGKAVVFGDMETLRNAQLNLGDCALARGDATAALEIFEELERAMAADTDPGEWMKWRYVQHLLLGFSQTWLALGDPERALADADRCVERAEATLTKRYVSKGKRARALALAALARPDEAAAEFDAALRIAEGIGGPELIWRTHAARAEVHADAGEDGASRAAAREALAVVEGIVSSLREPGAAEVLLASPDVNRLRALAEA
jgi:tetratricopeptide (TPR) repeat protein